MLTSKRPYSSGLEQAARDRTAVGPATWRSAVLFIVTGVGLYYYFENEKKRVKARKEAELANVKTGRPKVGGPFSLIDQDGKPFTESNLLGKWSLVYFGFTNCPDICPDELDKMGVVVDLIEKQYGADKVLPVFVSVDPARDSVTQVKKYLSEFHPKMVGLTGSYDDVKKMCKAYRVYFSTPPDVKQGKQVAVYAGVQTLTYPSGEDYLVDHSIYFYLMDPEGQFVNAFGKSNTASDVKLKFDEAIIEWRKDHPGGTV
ncbi:Cu-binding protein [Tulasnella sp. 403]|nr:Cu-binding protein [Tulasnella sp. 403]